MDKLQKLQCKYIYTFFFLFCISEAMAFVWECSHMSACLY